ncbi:glycosyltransferase family 2 protein [Fibrobacterota bacterium]
MQLVSVVIVSHNSGSQLENYLDRVLTQTYGDIEVIIIDNASCSDTVGYLKRLESPVRVFYNSENTGFAAGQNQGIRAANGQFILSLNPDVKLETTFIASLVEAMSSSDAIGMVNGKILRIIGNRPSGIIDCAGTILTRERAFLNRGEGEKDTGQYDNSPDIFGISGSAALLRKSMLTDIQQGEEYYDESLFCYGEDFDLSWRARAAGWKARFEPGAVAYHEVSASSPFSNFARSMIFRNRYLIMIKNESPRNFFAGLPHILFYEAFNITRVILHPSLVFTLLRHGKLFLLAWGKRVYLRPRMRRAQQVGRNLPSGKADILRRLEAFVMKAFGRRPA